MSKTIEDAAAEYADKAYYPAPDYGWYESDDEQMKECLSNAFKAGANHVYGLPLASRMTEEEKERVRELHYHLKSVLAYCHPSADKIVEATMRDLESIFGKEFFEEE